MIRKRTSVLVLSAALALGGVSACGDDNGGNQGNRDGGLEEDLSDAGEDISEGVEDLSDELSEQIDEGTEEDNEGEGGG
jgi:hypothetical protein